MGVALNHDEHQFIAAGQLLAQHALLPYRDYPYFHTPVLVLVYAALFEQTDHLFFAARLFSMVCAWLSGIGIFIAAWMAFRAQENRRRFLFALGAALLFFTNPAFVYTFGKAWNNSLPVFLMLAAFLLQCHGAAQRKKWPFFLGGVLLVLAIGTRISFAPLGLPFLVMAWFVPAATLAQRLAFVGSLGAGMALGLLPTALVVLQAPGQFFFDNFIYNSRVNILYRQASGDVRSPWPAKIFFVLKTLVNPGNLALFAGFLYFAGRPFFQRTVVSYPLRFIVLLFPFVLLGTLAPTPSYTQYYYPLAALCVLGLVYGLAAHDGSSLRPVLAAGLVLIVSGASTIYEYRHVGGVFSAANWIPLQLHEEGRVIASHVKGGDILTLAPTVPLEGGLGIYESLATGAFAWRTAPFLSATERLEYNFLAPDDLARALAERPPAGILLGYQKKLEKELTAYAKGHAYERVNLPDKKVLWIRPQK